MMATPFRLAHLIIACGVALIGLAALASADEGVFERREYAAFVPAGGGPDRPLILVLHGGKSDGPAMRRYTGFDAVARAFRAVAIYPSAPEKAWNDGRTHRIASSAVFSRDDVGYLTRLARFAADRYGASEERVFAIGISNGGGMVFRLACEAPSLIQGIGLVTTKLMPDYKCADGRPVPAILIFGDTDPLSPHEGRTLTTSPRKARQYGEMLSAGDTLAYWSRRNGCVGRSRLQSIDREPDDGTVVMRHTFEGCRSPLVYFEVIGGGHTWPGAPKRLGGRLMSAFLGATSYDINAGEEALRFWLSSPRPPGEDGRP